MLILLARVIYTPKTINLTTLTCVFHAPKKKRFGHVGRTCVTNQTILIWKSSSKYANLCIFFIRYGHARPTT